MDGVTGGFTRVSGYADWITEKVCANSDYAPAYLGCKSAPPAGAPKAQVPTVGAGAGSQNTAGDQPSANGSIIDTAAPSWQCFRRGKRCSKDWECCNWKDRCIAKQCLICQKLKRSCKFTNQCCGYQQGGVTCLQSKCTKCTSKKGNCKKASDCCSGKCVMKRAKRKNGKKVKKQKARGKCK
jgi:hypothetical protein